LEFLRYGLNCLPDDGQARERSQTIQRLVAGNLDTGRLAIDIQTKDGIPYRVERVLDDDPAIFTSEGEPVNISLPGPLFSAEVYSQNEIEEIANNPRFQLDLLDKFIRQDIDDIERKIEETCKHLGINADRVQTSQRELHGFRDQLRELPDVTEKLKAFEKAKDGRDDKELRAEHAAKALRDRQARMLTEAKQALAGLRGELETVGMGPLSCVQEIDPSQLASGPNAPFMTELGQVLSEATQQVDKGIHALHGLLTKAEERIVTLSGKMRQQYTVQERQYREVLERFEQEKGKAQERARLMKRQAELQDIEKHRTEVQEALRKQWGERQQRIQQLVGLRDQRFQLRQGVANYLNERLAPVIRVQIEQCGNTDQYRDLLLEAMRRSGLRYSPLVEKVVVRIPPEDLATIVRRDNADLLAEQLDIDQERAMKFIAPLRDHRVLHRIETVELHDRPTIELKDGEQYKDSTMLSTGQKCTAILPILLLESESPLLIDQPEDNLDNAFVFDTVVRSLLRVKASRQLIFVTHNPNIPVLGEADRIFVMTSTGTEAQVSAVGTVDEMRSHIERLLEGGSDAFRRRMEKYGY